MGKKEDPRFAENCPAENIELHGFFRMKVGEEGKVVSDTGWVKNRITNDGFNQYICCLLGKLAGSKTPDYLSVGTGTQPAEAGTTLDGEYTSGTKRRSVNAATNGTPASRNLILTASFASSLCGAQQTLQNVGLFYSNTGSTLFAGQTYAQQTWNTNQDLSVTYQLNFASSTGVS